MAHLVAQGEPQLAFACFNGTIAREHQKASGARPGKHSAKDFGWVCESFAARQAAAKPLAEVLRFSGVAVGIAP